MIATVKISASEMVNVLSGSLPDEVKHGIAKEVHRRIQYLLIEGNDEDAIPLCKSVAELFPFPVVASHFINSYVLNIFLDAIPDESMAHFLYTKHYTQVH